MGEPVAGASAELSLGTKGLEAGLDKTGRAFVAWERSVQRSMSRITGEGPTLELRKIEGALERLGGASKLSGQQVENLQKRIQSLTAAGGRLPAALKGLSAGGGIGAALKTQGAQELNQLAASAGPAGAILAGLGPQGLAAAAGIGALGAAASVTAGTLLRWTQGALDAAGKLSDLNAQTDISTDALQEYAHVGGLVGVSSETIANSVQKASIRIAEGGAGVRAALGQIGLGIEEVQALKPEEQFRVIAEALKGVQSAGERGSIAEKLFGRDRTILRLIREDFVGAAEDAQRFGVVMDADAVAAADKLGDALTTLTNVWTGFQNQVGVTIASSPQLLSGIELLTEGVASLSKTFQDGSGASAFFGTFVTGIQLASGQISAFIKQAETALTIAQSLGLVATVNPRAARKQSDFERMAAGDIGPGGISTAATERAAREAFGRQVELDKKLAAERERLAKATAERLNKLAEGFTGEATQKQLDDLVKVFDLHRPAIEGSAVGWTKFVDQVLRLDREGANVPERIRAITQAAQRGEFVGPMPDELPGGLTGAGSGSLLDLIPQQTFNADLTRPALEALTEAEAKTIDWSAALADVSHTFQILGISADSGLGRVLGGLTAAGASVDKLQAGLTKNDKFSFSNIGKGGFGAVIGQLGAGLGVAGAAVSIGRAIGGLFSSSPVERATKGAMQELGIKASEALAEKIATTADKLGVNERFASLLNLSEVIDESGKDPSVFFGKTINLLEAVALEAVPAAEGLSEIGEVFDKLAESAENGSEAAARALIDLQRRAKELDLEIPGMEEFRAGQIDKASAGFETFLGGLETDKRGKVSAEQAGANEVIFGALFEATSAQLGVVESAERMRASFEALRASLPKGTELTGPAADAARILSLLDDEGFKGAAEAAKGLADTLNGLQMTDSLSQATMDAIGTSAQTLFEQALGTEGATREDALTAVLPLLAQLSKAQALGATLSPEEIALLQEAQEAGILPLQDVATQSLEVEREIRDGVNRLAGQGFPGIPEAAGGGILSGPMSGFPAILHGDEAVLPLNNPAAMADVLRQAGILGGVSVTGGPISVVINGTNLSQQQLIEAVTRGVESGTGNLRTAIVRAVQGQV